MYVNITELCYSIQSNPSLQHSLTDLTLSIIYKPDPLLGAQNKSKVFKQCL